MLSVVDLEPEWNLQFKKVSSHHDVIQIKTVHVVASAQDKMAELSKRIRVHLQKGLPCTCEPQRAVDVKNASVQLRMIQRIQISTSAAHGFPGDQ